MGILELSNDPYSNQWFTVPKNNGSLRFIQDLQPMNKVTIWNSGVGPIVNEFAEAFAKRAIYSIGDLYSRYDQFQSSLDSQVQSCIMFDYYSLMVNNIHQVSFKCHIA